MTTKFWAVNGTSWRPSEGVVRPRIEPGIYEMQVQESLFGATLSLNRIEPKTDTLYMVPGSVGERVVETVFRFWSHAERYKRMGVLHKRGLLLEGPPGTGKTVLCLTLGREIAVRGGLSLFVAPSTDADYLSNVVGEIRAREPELPLVAILEDIDQHRPDNLLRILDGDQNAENIVFLATTNYVGKLDHRLTNRPSRFDEVIHVGAPDHSVRYSFLRLLLPSDVEDNAVVAMAAESDGLTFAQLKELAVTSYIYGREAAATVARMVAMGERVATPLPPKTPSKLLATVPRL